MGRLFGEGRRVRIATQPVEVVVKPRPRAAATPWLPAHAVTLSEEWSEEPSQLVAGEPVTWTLRLGAEGLTGEQLPPIEPPAIDSAADLPRPAFHRDPRRWACGVRGARSARRDGTGRGRGAEDPGAAGGVVGRRGGCAAHCSDPCADDCRRSSASHCRGGVPPRPRRSTAAPEVSPRLWQGISAALTVVWLVTLGALLRVLGRRRRSDTVSSSPAETLPRDTDAARRRVLDACRDADPRAARGALLHWAGLVWPESPPRDLIVLAARVHDEPLAETILDIDRALWATRDSDWAGQSLAARLPRELGPPPSPRRRAAMDRLPSLHPA